MRKNLENKLIMWFFVERFVFKRCAARFACMVLMLVAIRLYIRECIIPFDIIYAEELVKEDIQQEETNGWTWWQKALVISGIIVIIICGIKTYQLNSELINVKNELDTLASSIESRDLKIKSAFGKITERTNLTTQNIIKINGRVNIHSSWIAQTIDEVNKLKNK